MGVGCGPLAHPQFRLYLGKTDVVWKVFWLVWWVA